MPSSYPGSLDSFTTKVDNVTDVLAAHMNDVQNAIVATQTELGTDPAGSFATVLLRLNNNPLNKLDGTTAPTVNEDTGDGYGPGSIWVDVTNDRSYICLDASAGAAVWKNISSAIGTWTPTVTQSGAVAATVTLAQYQITGALVTTNVILTVTAAGTGNNTIVIGGQPAAIQPVTVDQCLGTVMLSDTGTANYIGIVYAQAAATWHLYAHSSATPMGQTPNFALANGDIIRLNCTYRIA